MTTALELRQRRAGLINQAREILDVAEGEDRAMTQEEDNRYNALFDQANDLGQRIETVERQADAERDLQLPIEPGTRPEPEGRGDGRPDGDRMAVEFLSRGMRDANQRLGDLFQVPEWRRLAPTVQPAYSQAFNAFLRTGQWRGEARALQADSDPAGGFLVTPMQFVDALIKSVDDMVWIRQWATVISVPNADSLGAPTLENDPADADWTTELATGSEDSSMDFGRRALHPHPLAKRLKISRKLLAKVPSSEALARDRLAYKFGITWEKAGLTGSGSEQPLGVFTASSDGISTSRDVSTGNTTSSPTFDGLIEAKYTLKGQYWPRARWLFHRDGVKLIAKLKDGNGQYMWRESVREGEPDRLLGLPAHMSEYAPNTFTTGLYAGILGDFSQYWIADSMSLELQRLGELYAETNQVGLIGRLESDGMPVLEEAFVRVKLA